MADPLPLPDLPFPDDLLPYRPLPATADDGFPQSFLLELDGTVYRIGLGVTFRDPAVVLGLAYADQVFDLPDPVLGLFLTVRAERDDLPDGSRLLGIRRAVLDRPLALGPLAFRFRRIRVARGNLVGPGAFGSQLLAEVAPRHD